MKRLIAIGKYFRRKKFTLCNLAQALLRVPKGTYSTGSTIIDLSAYRELKRPPATARHAVLSRGEADTHERAGKRQEANNEVSKTRKKKE